MSSDEAGPIYSDFLENIRVGNDFLMREFNVTPRFGWQLDPFGHSASMAKLFGDLGFEGVFFGRMDDSLK